MTSQELLNHYEKVIGGKFVLESTEIPESTNKWTGEVTPAFTKETIFRVNNCR